MKKIILILALCSFTMLYAQQKNDSLILVGKWTPVDKTVQAPDIVIHANGNYEIIMPENQIPMMKYKLDSTKDPMWLDIIMEFNGETRIMNGLAKLIDVNTLKLEMFMENTERPVKFSDPDSRMMLMLKKVQ